MPERLLLVVVGAGIGGGVRYLIGLWAAERFGAAFPVGTLLINTSGSFVLAFLLAHIAARSGAGPELRLLLGTGFCGGYTTFSAFAAETLALVEGSQVLAATLNVLLNVALSQPDARAGVWLARLA